MSFGYRHNLYPFPHKFKAMLTNTEIEEIADKFMVMDGETGAMFLEITEFAHAIIAADRSKRPFSLEPIPLSQRKPDCFGSMCWFYEICDGSWDYMDCCSMNLERPGHGWTHWLPGHAFPLPPEDV